MQCDNILTIYIAKNFSKRDLFVFFRQPHLHKADVQTLSKRLHLYYISTSPVQQLYWDFVGCLAKIRFKVNCDWPMRYARIYKTENTQNKHTHNWDKRNFCKVYSLLAERMCTNERVRPVHLCCLHGVVILPVNKDAIALMNTQYYVIPDFRPQLQSPQLQTSFP